MFRKILNSHLMIKIEKKYYQKVKYIYVFMGLVRPVTLETREGKVFLDKMRGFLGRTLCVHRPNTLGQWLNRSGRATNT
jgi:hypothetical protein